MDIADDSGDPDGGLVVGLTTRSWLVVRVETSII